MLALLLPPVALSASILARARRDGGRIGRALTWALEWWLPALVVCLGIYGLSVVGVIPASGVPYDPARYELGVGEAVMLVLLVALAVWLWWILRLRRIPLRPAPRALGGAAGLAAVVACVRRLDRQSLSGARARAARPRGRGPRRPGRRPAAPRRAGRRSAAAVPLAAALDLRRLGARLGRVGAVAARGADRRRRHRVLQVVGGFLFVASVAAVLTAALAT